VELELTALALGPFALDQGPSLGGGIGSGGALVGGWWLTASQQEEQGKTDESDETSPNRDVSLGHEDSWAPPYHSDPRFIARR
jgi:hypothetical protein